MAVPSCDRPGTRWVMRVPAGAPATSAASAADSAALAVKPLACGGGVPSRRSSAGKRAATASPYGIAQSPGAASAGSGASAGTWAQAAGVMASAHAVAAAQGRQKLPRPGFCLLRLAMAMTLSPGLSARRPLAHHRHAGPA